MIREEEVFKIGQFAKPHGIKGELSLVTNSDVLEDAEDPYIVCEMDGILVPFFVEDFRYKNVCGQGGVLSFGRRGRGGSRGGYDVGQFYRLYRDGRTERLFRRDNRRG